MIKYIDCLNCEYYDFYSRKFIDEHVLQGKFEYCKKTRNDLEIQIIDHQKYIKNCPLEKEFEDDKNCIYIPENYKGEWMNFPLLFWQDKLYDKSDKLYLTAVSCSPEKHEYLYIGIKIMFGKDLAGHLIKIERCPENKVYYDTKNNFVNRWPESDIKYSEKFKPKNKKD
jgi:hypothetical protein